MLYQLSYGIVFPDAFITASGTAERSNYRKLPRPNINPHFFASFGLCVRLNIGTLSTLALFLRFSVIEATKVTGYENNTKAVFKNSRRIHPPEPQHLYLLSPNV